jgi:hypothetical protein
MVNSDDPPAWALDFIDNLRSGDTPTERDTCQQHKLQVETTMVYLNEKIFFYDHLAF